PAEEPRRGEGDGQEADGAGGKQGQSTGGRIGRRPDCIAGWRVFAGPFLYAGRPRPGERCERSYRSRAMSGPKRPTDEIDRMAAAETAAFLRRASVTYLECCISLMLTHLPREEVAAILNQEAQM